MRGLLLAVVAAGLLAGCREQVDRPVRQPAEGGLVFVTTLGGAPYTYWDEQKRDYAGIDVEIARAAARRMGLPLEVRVLEFSKVMPALKSGEADFAAAAITITPSRRRDVAFSRPYASDGSAFLYRAADPAPTMPRAFNLRIGTQRVSVSHFYLCFHDVDPYCYVNYEEALAAFRRGELDAVFYDAASIRETVCASNGAYAITPLETRENYGVAVRKDYPALVEALDAVIAERGRE